MAGHSQWHDLVFSTTGFPCMVQSRKDKPQDYYFWTASFSDLQKVERETELTKHPHIISCIVFIFSGFSLLFPYCTCTPKPCSQE
jgi:hypothetical protein